MSATETSPATRLNGFITLVVVLCAGVGVWQCCRDMICREIVGAFVHGGADRVLGLGDLHDYDANFHSAAPQGNLAIRFFNFDSNDQTQVNVVQEMFARGAYTLYPRRVWVVPEGTVLNGGRDVLSANFAPTPQWLREHDVRAVVEMRAEQNGGRSIRLVPVKPDGAP